MKLELSPSAKVMAISMSIMVLLAFSTAFLSRCNHPVKEVSVACDTLVVDTLAVDGVQ